MPLGRYYGGKGRFVMREMQRRYVETGGKRTKATSGRRRLK